MSYYAKTTVSSIVAESSTYSDPVAKVAQEHATQPVAWFHQVATIAAGKSSAPSFVLDLSPNYLNLTADSFLISNKGSNRLTVEMWNKVDDLAHPSAGISWGGGYITDDTSDSSYFENVRVGDYLFSANAGNAYNRKLFIVSDLISSGVAWPKRIGVSLYSTAMATHAGDDAASFVHLTRNVIHVPAGSFCHIPGGLANLDLREITGASSVGAEFNELKLYSKSGTTQAEIFITGA